MAEQRDAEFRRWIMGGLYLLLTIMVLTPVFAVQVPCLGDYLNHLARIDIMSKLSSSRVLQGFYDINWKFVPYFGMDIPTLLLGHIMPIYMAGRLFIAVCVLMPVAAVATLRFAVHGRVGFVPVLAYLFCYNYLLERGFLAYLFSVGLAIFLFAGWIKTRTWPTWRRTALFSLGVGVLYLSHAYGFLVYCILIAGYEMSDALKRGFRPLMRVARDRAAAAFQLLPAVLAGALLGGDDNVNGASFNHYGSVSDKLGALLSPLYFPRDQAVLPTLVFLAVATALTIRHCRLSPDLVGPAVAIGLAGIAAPSVLFNAWGTDFRLPLVLMIVLLAGVLPPATLGRDRVAIVLVTVFVLVAARSTFAYILFNNLDSQVSEMRQLVTSLPMGQRLLVVEDARQAAPMRVAPKEMTEHIALIAAIDRSAFLPFLFLGNTTIRPLPRYSNSSSRLSSPINMEQLQSGLIDADPPGGPPPYGWGGHEYWLGWPRKFDYVLIEHFGAAIVDLPAVLRPVARSSLADLYQIVVPADGGMR